MAYLSSWCQVWLRVRYAFDLKFGRKAYRIMMLIAMMNPPGVWITIMGMLRAPTSFMR